jgi:hypothetical protein
MQSNPKSLLLSQVQSRSQYPLSSLIHNEFLKLKDIYLNELKSLHSKYNNSEENGMGRETQDMGRETQDIGRGT